MRVLILTGAGVSADSGLPTFRDDNGLWEGHRLEDVASPRAWSLDPGTVWRFYQLRRAALATVVPNAAHLALAALERVCESRAVECRLVTQNVDDLHERAGSRPTHLHGELAVLRCETCGARLRDLERTDPARFVPCAGCGASRLRPDVVWFGEPVPLAGECIEWAAECTHFLSIGTSGVVFPAAHLLEVARECGAATFVQALERPANLRRPDRFLQGRAAEVVPRLCAEIEGVLP